MNFGRSDKAFEEAGQDPEKCEQLLDRLKRERKIATRFYWSVVLGLILLALPLVVFLCESLWSVYRFFHGLNTGHPAPFPTTPAWLNYFVDHLSRPGGAVFLAPVFLFYVAMMNLAMGIRELDNRIKTLLLFRAHRDAMR